jgi:hypothetical protein
MGWLGSLSLCLLLIAQSTADQADPDLILSQGFVRNGDPKVSVFVVCFVCWSCVSYAIVRSKLENKTKEKRIKVYICDAHIFIERFPYSCGRRLL